MRRDAAERTAEPTVVCPDAEVLASWVEGRLTRDQQAAAERHVADCARCLSVVAALARAAPAAAPPLQPRGAWARWLVPITAAATAVAIWVAIPEQQEVPESKQVAVAPPAAGVSQPLAAPEPQRTPQTVAPSAPVAEPARRQEARADSIDEAAQDRLREERAFSGRAASDERVARELGAEARSLARDAGAPAGPPPAVPQAANEARPQSEAAGALGGQRANAPVIVEAASASDAAIRWRIVDRADVERSLDGGQTWTRTARPPLAVWTIRVTDALSATVTTASGAGFSTVDGGKTWTPVQEKPATPF
jgi:hypothetical protein